MLERTALIVGCGFLLLLIPLGVLEWHDYQNRLGLRQRGVITSATITSREGPFVAFGSRRRVDRFNYWLEYERHRFQYQSRTRREVGARLQVIYDRAHPEIVRVMAPGENRREDLRPIAWRYLPYILLCGLIGLVCIVTGLGRTRARPRKSLFASMKSRP